MCVSNFENSVFRPDGARPPTQELVRFSDGDSYDNTMAETVFGLFKSGSLEGAGFDRPDRSSAS